MQNKTPVYFDIATDVMNKQCSFSDQKTEGEGRMTSRFDTDLEKDVRAHGFTMCNNRLLIFALAIPAIQLNAPAA